MWGVVHFRWHCSGKAFLVQEPFVQVGERRLLLVRLPVQVEIQLVVYGKPEICTGLHLWGHECDCDVVRL